ncbi:MAG: 3-phosphoshikimate 1-carboxyvinyltransferase [Oscillospiraceae bacterium]|nr:3-phosphoshikimate 1-carboxyvinyltransferase [Oscillospiraceae bacterium]
MTKAIITPTKLSGTVTVPPSKSVAHRAIIAAAFAVLQSSEPTTVRNIQLSEDIAATLHCIRNLGCDFEHNPQTGEVLIFAAKSSVDGDMIFDCGESGSTLRFFIPIALALGGKSIFTGRGRLLARPQTPYFEIFDKLGINYTYDSEKITVDGRLAAGEYQLKGDVSSQFVTGLLFALTLIDGESRITMTTPLASRGYVDLTLKVLKDFGVEIENDNYETFTIKTGQAFACNDYTVEGDYSQAAFWLVAAQIGNNVKCGGLNPESLQGDREIVDIISSEKNKKYYVNDSGGSYVNIDVDEIPDLVPILTVLCSLKYKKSKLINAGRLRIKESDRLNAIATELNKLGGKITEGEDYLEIEGVDGFHGGEVSAHNDHRIAMALAIAATRASGDVIINNAECVKKSYPHFWEDYAKLGGLYATS